MLLHVSLLLFFIGLVLYVRQSDPVMSKGIFFITAVFYMVYFMTSFLPVLFPQCPYRSPLSTGGIWLKSLGAWLVHAMRCDPQQRRPYVLKTPADREWDAVAKCPKGLIPHSMERAMRESPSLSVALTVIQAASSFTVGLDHDHSQYPDKEHRKCALLRESILAWLYGALTSRRAVFEWAPGRENELQRMTCVLLLIPLDWRDNVVWDEINTTQYHTCISRILQALTSALLEFPSTPTSTTTDVATLSMTLLALGNRLDDLDRNSKLLQNGALFDTITTAYSSLSEPPSLAVLRLRPVIWHQALTYLRNHGRPMDEAQHFVIALWRSAHSKAPFPDGDDRRKEHLATLPRPSLQEWLYLHPDRSEMVTIAMYCLLCPQSCKSHEV